MNDINLKALLKISSILTSVQYSDHICHHHSSQVCNEKKNLSLTETTLTPWIERTVVCWFGFSPSLPVRPVHQVLHSYKKRIEEYFYIQDVVNMLRITPSEICAFKPVSPHAYRSVMSYCWHLHLISGQPDAILPRSLLLPHAFPTASWTHCQYGVPTWRLW